MDTKIDLKKWIKKCAGIVLAVSLLSLISCAEKTCPAYSRSEKKVQTNHEIFVIESNELQSTAYASNNWIRM